MAKESSALSEGKAKQTDFMRAALMMVNASLIVRRHSSTSDHFLPPLRTAVRGMRIFAAAGMNWW